MNLADRIRKRLKAMGLRRSAASKRAQLNETYVRDLIEGRVQNPRTEHLARLALVLGTTPEWLLEGRGPEEVNVDTTSFEAAQAAWAKIPPGQREQALRVLKSFVREEQDEPFAPEPARAPAPRKRQTKK